MKKPIFKKGLRNLVVGGLGFAVLMFGAAIICGIFIAIVKIVILKITGQL